MNMVRKYTVLALSLLVVAGQGFGMTALRLLSPALIGAGAVYSSQFAKPVQCKESPIDACEKRIIDTLRKSSVGEGPLFQELRMDKPTIPVLEMPDGSLLIISSEFATKALEYCVPNKQCVSVVKLLYSKYTPAVTSEAEAIDYLVDFGGAIK